MSIKFDLEDDGKIRVKVDRKGERAVSDVMDPLEMMHEIAEAAEWDAGVEGNEFVVTLPDELSDPGDSEETEGNEDPTQELPDDPTEEVPVEPEPPEGESGIDESAPPEGEGEPENPDESAPPEGEGEPDDSENPDEGTVPDDGTGQDMTDDIPPEPEESQPENSGEEPSA